MPKIYAPTRKGAPQPAAIEGLIKPEVFDRFKAECHNAGTSAEFQAVVTRYNHEQHWYGSVVGYTGQEYSTQEKAVDFVLNLG